MAMNRGMCRICEKNMKKGERLKKIPVSLRESKIPFIKEIIYSCEDHVYVHHACFKKVTNSGPVKPGHKGFLI